MMTRWQKLASATIVVCAMAVGGPGSAAAQTQPAQTAPAQTKPAQTKPEGEMRFALHVTILPAWLDPFPWAAPLEDVRLKRP
jgi:hypothetical protein